MKYPALMIALLIGTGSAAGQSPASSASSAASVQPPQPTVFRSGASLVALNVTVTDGKAFVPGLGLGDFAVFEDGVKQDVQFLEATNVPLDLVVLIDTSASMRERMPMVHEAALGFLQSLRDGDRGAVVEFNDTVNVAQALTSDRLALGEAVRRTEARGGTALNNALYIALKQFGSVAQAGSDVRRQCIALLSDGHDTASVLSFDDVLGQARRSGVTVYTIGLKAAYQHTGPDGRRYFSESDYALRTLASETGAQSFFPTRVTELKGIYAVIAEELSHQYSIGYAPSNPRLDGRFRRIVVQITSQPGLKLRARRVYLADGPPMAPMDPETNR